MSSVNFTNDAKKLKKNSKLLIMLAHVWALLTVLFWGTSFLFTKSLMVDGGFTPVEMFVYRFALAYLLILLVSFREVRFCSWRDELTFLISGICSGSLYFITENYALQYTSAGNVSLLANLAPLFTTLMLAVIYKSRISSGVMIGSAVALLGIFAIILGGGEELSFNPKGDLLAISAAVCLAVYNIAVKRVIPYYTSLFITRKIFFYGVLTGLPMLFAQKEPSHFMLLFNLDHPEYGLSMLYLVLLCSIVGYIIWNEAMKYLGVEKANNYLYLQAPITMIVGAMFFGEPVKALGWVGAGLVLLGLIISDKIKGSLWSHKR